MDVLSGPISVIMSGLELERLLFVSPLFSQQINNKINIKKIGEKKIIQNIIAIKFNSHLLQNPHLQMRIQSIIIKSVIEKRVITNIIIHFFFLLF